MRLLTATILAMLAAAPVFPAGSGAGEAFQLAAGVRLEGPIRVTVRELPPAANRAPGQTRELLLSRRHPSQQAYEPGIPAPAANAYDRSFSPEPLAPPVPAGAGFEGLDNGDNDALSGVTPTPPDPQVAVGPNHVFEMVNIVGSIYTRTGESVQTFTLANFFGVPAGYLDTDPKVFYDALSSRWFASYVSLRDLPGASNDQGRLHLAISQTSDPTGVWNVYFLAYAQLFPDYAGIGVTNDKFTISSNIFDIDQPFYYGADTIVIEKVDVLAGLPGGSVGLFAFPRNLNRFTVRPAQSLSSTSDQYLTMRYTATTLTVIRITGTPDAGNVTEASATNLTMLAQNTPPPSVALGGNIDSGDSRLLDATWRNGRLWTSASAACLPSGDSTTRSCAHVIEIDTSAMPSIAQDIMFGAAGEYFSWPALRTGASGDLYVSLTHTNAATFAEARATGRLAGDPPNTMTGSTVLRAGDVAHDSSRWGDYLAAAVDPLFPECVWLVGEYAKNTVGENWGTFIAAMSYSAGCDSDGDGFTDAAEASIGTGAVDPCGNNGWPAELSGNDNSLNIGDFNSFLFPLRGNASFNKFAHPVPDPDDLLIARWNLLPDATINIGDLNALNPAVNSPTSQAPMFGGQPAFFTDAGNGVGGCPFPP